MAETLRPIPFSWDGSVMRPHPRFRKLCDDQFAAGETYVLAADERASTASRNHYFAALHDAWLNLPEDQAQRFPSPEFLRRWALVQAGYANERVIPCDSEADAKRMALTARALDGYCVIVRKGTVVQIWTAQSQSHKSMTKEQFQASKSAVLDIVSKMIGVTRGELQKQAGMSA